MKSKKSKQAKSRIYDADIKDLILKKRALDGLFCFIYGYQPYVESAERRKKQKRR